MGLLDDEIDRQAAVNRAAAERAAAENARLMADAEARATADRGPQIAKEFVERARLFGLIPSRRLETVESEATYEWVTHWSGSKSQFWSEPRELSRKFWGDCWSLGGTGADGISEYLISESGQHVVESDRVLLSEEPASVRWLHLKVPARRKFRTTWVEIPVSETDTIDGWDPDGRPQALCTVPEAMARVVVRRL